MRETKVLAVICAISMFVGGCQSHPKKTNHGDVGI